MRVVGSVFKIDPEPSAQQGLHSVIVMGRDRRAGRAIGHLNSDVDLERRLIFVRRSWTKKGGFKDLTKSGDDRVVEIAPPFQTVFKRHWFEHPDSVFALPRIDTWDAARQAEMLRHFAIGLGLPPVNFHALRASWATIMLSQGVEMVKVMKMGGWKNLKVLNDHYLRLSGVDIKGSTNALNFHSPIADNGTLLQFPATTSLNTL